MHKLMFNFLIGIVSMFYLISCYSTPSEKILVNNNQQPMKYNYKHLALSDTIGNLAKHPAFEGFGELLLTRDNNSSLYNIPLSHVGLTMPYHAHVQPNVILQSINHMIDEVNSGQTIFYDIYTEEQKQQDPEKANTGLFFYRGELGAPFAIISPGGGFAYVGSLHEGFPIAYEISKKGLNAFVIKYRIGSEKKATEDLAAAIKFIFNHSDKLGVNTNNYSLWGGSAGARMVGNIAFNGLSFYGVDSIPQPITAIIAYTGQSSYSNHFPATFLIVSENDGIASASVMKNRAQNLKKVGVQVEFHQYKSASHGFGSGKGTDAEGWIDDAVTFWQMQIR